MHRLMLLGLLHKFQGKKAKQQTLLRREHRQGQNRQDQAMQETGIRNSSRNGHGHISIQFRKRRSMRTIGSS